MSFRSALSLFISFALKRPKNVPRTPDARANAGKKRLVLLWAVSVFSKELIELLRLESEVRLKEDIVRFEKKFGV